MNLSDMSYEQYRNSTMKKSRKEEEEQKKKKLTP